MLKNETRQDLLDRKKWELSEKEGEDKSGQMYYCFFCDYQTGTYIKPNYDTLFSCDLIHPKRVEQCACARAYNRFIKEQKKAKQDNEAVVNYNA